MMSDRRNASVPVPWLNCFWLLITFSSVNQDSIMATLSYEDDTHGDRVMSDFCCSLDVMVTMLQIPYWVVWCV